MFQRYNLLKAPFSGPLGSIWCAFSGCAYTESGVPLVIISKAETVKIMLSLNTPIRRNTPAFFSVSEG